MKHGGDMRVATVRPGGVERLDTFCSRVRESMARVRADAVR